MKNAAPHAKETDDLGLPPELAEMVKLAMREE